MKLAIADPPYLGCADRYYGNGRGDGRGRLRADYDPAAYEWDTAATHTALVRRLDREYDAWAVAMSVHSLGVYAAAVKLGPTTGYRFGAWVKPRSTPSGSRIATSWEPVLFHIPQERRRYDSGSYVNDHLVTAAGGAAFMGAKPATWTRWVLDVLGYDPQTDTVDDLFPGSGSVSNEINQGVLL